ncbi:MAG: rhodanese-like domain-containing protein [Polyangia bacterium]
MEAIDDALRALDFDYFSKGLHKISPAALFERPRAVFVDIRCDEELEVLPIRLGRPTCIHLPLHELPTRWHEIPRDRPVGLFCSGDIRSSMALAYLLARGYGSARIVSGGYEALVAQLEPGKLRGLLSARD